MNNKVILFIVCFTLFSLNLLEAAHQRPSPSALRNRTKELSRQAKEKFHKAFEDRRRRNREIIDQYKFHVKGRHEQRALRVNDSLKRHEQRELRVNGSLKRHEQTDNKAEKNEFVIGPFDPENIQNALWSSQAAPLLPFSRSDAPSPPNVIYQGKIGFVFLGYGDHNAHETWQSFFDHVHPSIRDNPEQYYRILYHPKFRDQVHSNLFKKNIVNQTVGTKWGGFSLVRATLILLEEMYYLDKDVEFFIFLSDSCVPIITFDQIYTETFQSNATHFTFHSEYKFKQGCPQKIAKNIAKSQIAKSLRIPATSCVKHQQFFTMRRDHVKMILENKQFNNILKRLWWPDEGYFGSALLSAKEIYTDEAPPIVFHQFEDLHLEELNNHVWYPNSRNCEVRQKWYPHPLYINRRLLEYFMNNSTCHFVRKVFPKNGKHHSSIK